MIPEFYKWRCTECREEPLHSVYYQGKLIKIGSCICKNRTLELVPLTERKYYARLTS